MELKLLKVVLVIGGMVAVIFTIISTVTDFWIYNGEYSVGIWRMCIARDICKSFKELEG